MSDNAQAMAGLSRDLQKPVRSPFWHYKYLDSKITDEQRAIIVSDNTSRMLLTEIESEIEREGLAVEDVNDGADNYETEDESTEDKAFAKKLRGMSHKERVRFTGNKQMLRLGLLGIEKEAIFGWHPSSLNKLYSKTILNNPKMRSLDSKKTNVFFVPDWLKGTKFEEEALARIKNMETWHEDEWKELRETRAWYEFTENAALQIHRDKMAQDEEFIYYRNLVVEGRSMWNREENGPGHELNPIVLGEENGPGHEGNPIVLGEENEFGHEWDPSVLEFGHEWDPSVLELGHEWNPSVLDL